jgi:hypothetical protein
MALSEQPLAVKNVVQFGLYAPSVVVHEHWPVSQRMIVEMGYSSYRSGNSSPKNGLGVLREA